MVACANKALIEPVLEEVSAFAPATVANLGPGYDWFGCAVQVIAKTLKLGMVQVVWCDCFLACRIVGARRSCYQWLVKNQLIVIAHSKAFMKDGSGVWEWWSHNSMLGLEDSSVRMSSDIPVIMSCAMFYLQGDGDVVTARVLPDKPGEVVISEISGDGGRLPLKASENCVGIAAIEALKLIGDVSCGVELCLDKVGYILNNSCDWVGILSKIVFLTRMFWESDMQGMHIQELLLM